MKKFLLLFLFTWTGAQAQNTTKKQIPLNFEAARNGLQVLPQKFEYGLLDADRIRIGDILIDTRTFKFQLVPRNGLFALRFAWPAGLLTKGQLILLNNNGKALWSKDFRESDIKITPASENENSRLRAELADLTSEDLEPALVEQLKLLPFVTFCVSYNAPDTKIYLCSRELFIGSAEGRLQVKERKTVNKKSHVEINGRVVGNQGIIFLNDSETSIFFKASAESGAYLEIDTRLNDIDFKDVMLSPEEGFILITASGTEPVSKDQKIEILGGEAWRAKVPMERPVLYLKGAGGIPMRQEFFVKSTPPKEAFRPATSTSSISKTYSSGVSLKVTAAPGTKLKPTGKEDQLRSIGKNRFEWQLSDLPRSQRSRRYLQVDAPGGTYFARYDVHRGPPFTLHAGAQYLTPAGVSNGFLQVQWWLENFITSFHSGIEFESRMPLSKKDTQVDFTEFRLSWLYRFNQGFNMEDETWGLGVPISMIKGTGFSLQSFGLSLWGFRKAPSFYPRWIKWYIPRLTFFGGASSTDIKLKSAYELSLLNLHALTDRHHLTYGLLYQNYAFEVTGAAADSKAQMGLNLGYWTSF